LNRPCGKATPCMPTSSRKKLGPCSPCWAPTPNGPSSATFSTEFYVSAATARAPGIHRLAIIEVPGLGRLQRPEGEVVEE